MSRQTANHYMRSFVIPKEINSQTVERIVADALFQVPLQQPPFSPIGDVIFISLLQDIAALPKAALA